MEVYFDILGRKGLNLSSFKVKNKQNIIYSKSCLDKVCDALLDPEHGEVHQTGRYLGDRAIYTCIPGKTAVDIKVLNIQKF